MISTQSRGFRPVPAGCVGDQRCGNQCLGGLVSPPYALMRSKGQLRYRQSERIELDAFSHNIASS
jgi:hypothetical protein